MYRSIAAAVALSCAAAGSPAMANDMVEVEGRVSYADLDLSEPSDIVAFEKRIAGKARQICRRGVPSELKYGRLVNECRASVVKSGKVELAKLLDHQSLNQRAASRD